MQKDCNEYFLGMKPKWEKLSSNISSNPFSYLPLSTNPTLQIRSSNLDVIGALIFCTQNRFLRLGASLHASIVKNSTLYNGAIDRRHSLLVWNSLLSMYFKSADTQESAAKVFDEMPVHDTVSLNTMISISFKFGEFGKGMGLFKQMKESGVHRINTATLTTLFSACYKPELCCVNEMLHGLVTISGFDRRIAVANSLMTSYFRCGQCGYGRRVFDEMVERDAVTWSAVVSGLAQNEMWEESLRLFEKMHGGAVNPHPSVYVSALRSCSGMMASISGRQIHGLIGKLGVEPDKFIDSALMDFYTKSRNMDDAMRIFASVREYDSVSVTVILAGLVRNGLDEAAIRLFVKLVRDGIIEVDPELVSAILGVSRADFGRQVHCFAIKRGFPAQLFIIGGLLNFYAKCGDLRDSIRVFDSTGKEEKNTVLYNFMIAAFARHGDGSSAIRLFKEMKSKNLDPTEATFVSLLHACSHGGMVREGLEIFDSMKGKYGMMAKKEHWSCVVDMLGRAGFLEEARVLIEGLEETGIFGWEALLGAASFHRDSEMVKYVAERLMKMEGGSADRNVLMANMFSFEGKWEEKENVRTGIMKKVTGKTWISN